MEEEKKAQMAAIPGPLGPGAHPPEVIRSMQAQGHLLGESQGTFLHTDQMSLPSYIISYYDLAPKK